MDDFFRMGQDRITREYVSIEEAHKNLDRYEIVVIDKKIKEIRDAIYEPEHIEGGVCWCGVIYEKREDGKMYITHKSQRDVVTDILRRP